MDSCGGLGQRRGRLRWWREISKASSRLKESLKAGLNRCWRSNGPALDTEKDFRERIEEGAKSFAPSSTFLSKMG